jgi:hypothetical protein
MRPRHVRGAYLVSWHELDHVPSPETFSPVVRRCLSKVFSWTVHGGVARCC